MAASVDVNKELTSTGLTNVRKSVNFEQLGCITVKVNIDFNALA